MKKPIALNQTADFLYNPSKVLVVCATTKTNYKDTVLYKSLVDQKYNGQFIIHTQNKTGLCKLYNNYIKKDWDIVIFVHDDVYIDSCNFVNKICEGFKKYDVCGLAGGSKIKIEKPLLWHIMSNKDTLTGVVSHGSQEKYMTTNFGFQNQRVSLLDGLFIAVQPKKLIEKKIRFDENIEGFHHYDLKFSIDCCLSKLKLGTIPLHVIHSSPGLQSFSDSYNKSEDYFYNSLKEIYGSTNG